MDNYNELKCPTCPKEFIENDMAFHCEKCGKNYCYECFCKDHYEQHSIWEVVMVKEGKFSLIHSEKKAVKELKRKKFPKNLLKKFW